MYMNRDKKIGGRAEKYKNVCPLLLVPTNFILNFIYGLQLTICIVFTKVLKFLTCLHLFTVFYYFVICFVPLQATRIGPLSAEHTLEVKAAVCGFKRLYVSKASELQY